MVIRNFIFPCLLASSLLLGSLPLNLALAHSAAVTPSTKAKAQFDSLSPEEKVGQLFLITFTGNDTSPVSPIFDLIVNYHLGGVILDRDNDNFLNLDQIPEECRTLSNNLQSSVKCVVNIKSILHSSIIY